MPMVRLGLRPRQEAIDSEWDFFDSAWPKAVEKQAHPTGTVICVMPSRTASSLLQYSVPFSVRDYRPEDFETLWQLDQECFPPEISYSQFELKTYIRKRGSFTLVAADGGNKIVGFIVAHGGKTGHIITIDVVSPARRAGVGSQLLQAAEDRLRAVGANSIGLETAVDNVSALAFYKGHGYNVIKTWPRYYSNGVDALVLRKEL